MSANWPVTGCSIGFSWWPTWRLADNQKTGNLTDNLNKISKKFYSEAVIGNFKTFRKRTAVFSSTSVSVVESYIFTASGHASWPWPCLSGPWDLIWIYHNRNTETFMDQLLIKPSDNFLIFSLSAKRPARVEVLSKNNVRLAVNSGEKKTFFTAKRPHLLALNALKAVNFWKICGF